MDQKLPHAIVKALTLLRMISDSQGTPLITFRPSKHSIASLDGIQTEGIVLGDQTSFTLYFCSKKWE